LVIVKAQGVPTSKVELTNILRESVLIIDEYVRVWRAGRGVRD
jgi:hypothetical protein